MKSRILKTISIIFILLSILSVNIYAATYSSTDRTVESEGDISITIKASENVQNYDISLTSYTGLTYVSCSANENAAVNTSTGAISYATLGSGTATLATYNFKAPNVTKDTTYNVVFNINGTANTAKVTVKAKEQPTVTPQEPEKPEEEKPTTTPETEKPTNSETQKPVVTEPTFKSVNEMVYAKEKVNIRKSYTTSSAVVGSLEKGASVTRIGVGSNGWSKVTYNGATAYINSNYITTTKPEEEKKSDNAYLKSLIIEGQELLPAFSKDTTTYTMQVGSDVTELNIKAEAEDSKATVSIEGNKDLKEGSNTLTVSVNAEDNTIKIYEITVTKAEKIALGLKSLTIKDTDIAKEFKTDVYNYEIDIEDVTKLEIEAVANNEKATVEILGNEDLEDGENTITIIVSSEDGKEKVTYQIKANKEIVQKTEEVTQKVEQQKGQISPKVYLYIALGAVLLIVLVIVIVHVIEHRNQENEFEYSDNFDEFPGELPNSIKEEKEFYDEEINIEQTNIEETKSLDVINDEYQQQYQEMNFDKEENKEKYFTQEVEENFDMQDKKAKIDYFLDNTEEDIKPKRRKGKHF